MVPLLYAVVKWICLIHICQTVTAWLFRNSWNCQRNYAEDIFSFCHYSGFKIYQEAAFSPQTSLATAVLMLMNINKIPKIKTLYHNY